MSHPKMGCLDSIANNMRKGLVCCFYFYAICLAIGFYFFFEDILQNSTKKTEPISADRFQNVQVSDPNLLKQLRDSILHPPSKLPYNLSSNHDFNKFYYESSKFYHQHLLNLFYNTRRGFFIEAGALDGETMSNSLWLEVKQNWTGLLVEPDPAFYERLLLKQRKVWSAKSCLSVEKYPRIESLSFESTMLNVQVGNESKSLFMKGGSFMKEFVNSTLMHKKQNQLTTYEETCFPLESFLLALNITKVDLLSLDVEYIEDRIINNFDFDRFDVQVIFIEWQFQERASMLVSFMQKQSYVFVENIVVDYVFVKAGSKYEDIVRRKKLIQPFKVFVYN